MIYNIKLTGIFEIISATKGRSNVLIVEYNKDNEDEDEDIIKIIEKEKNYKSAHIKLTNQSINEFKQELNRLSESNYTIIHITGGEEWLKQREGINSSTVSKLNELNNLTEYLNELNIKIIIYLPKASIYAIPTAAPKLWDLSKE